MDGQRIGSAKKYLPYHNALILHKSKNLTVKDQSNRFIVVMMLSSLFYLLIAIKAGIYF